MNASEILEVALEAYRETARIVLRASAPATLVTLAGYAFFWSYAFPLFWSTRDPNNLQTQVGEAAFALLLSIFVAVPIILFGVSYVSAITIQAVADFMVGNVPSPASARSAANRASPTLLKLLARQTLFGGFFFVIAVGLLLFSAWLTTSSGVSENDLAPITAAIAVFTLLLALAVAPAVAVRDTLIPSVAVVENLSAKESIRRGRKLLGSQIGSLMMAMALIAFLFLVFGVGLSSLDSQLGIGEWIADTFVGSGLHDLFTAAFGLVPWYVVLWITVPVWSTVATVLYFERRVAQEGFDIEMLSQDVMRSHRGHRFQL